MRGRRRKRRTDAGAVVSRRSAPVPERLLEVALYVGELERSVAFYRDVLGFSVVDRDERLVAMGLRGKALVLLCLRGASASRAPGGHDAAGRQHVAFAVRRAALPRWEAWLGARGVAIEERRDWSRGGRSLYFRDPDQHLLELASPGVWAIY